MELVALLRMLWRFRIAVAVGGIVAIALGFMATKGATSRFGVASMRVVLDTPHSQTVDVAPVGASTLEWRADLSADLMATEPTRSRIAQAVGIAKEQLVVSTPSMSVPIVPMPLPQAALDAAAAVPEPYQVSIGAASPLPIVAIDTRAPSREMAARLATVAAEALKTTFAGEAAPDTQQFVVDDVGPVQAREIVNPPRKMTAVIVVFVFFAFWCTCITLLAGFARPRRGSPHRQAVRAL
jgi:hypothetical protein